MVEVINFYKSIQCMILIIERNVDRIVYLLLPKVCLIEGIRVAGGYEGEQNEQFFQIPSLFKNSEKCYAR